MTNVILEKTFSTSPYNLNKTLQDWNDINVIYNRRHISKHLMEHSSYHWFWWHKLKQLFNLLLKEYPPLSLKNHFYNSHKL